MSNAERQALMRSAVSLVQTLARFRERQKKLKQRYRTGAGIDPAELRALCKEITRRRKLHRVEEGKGLWNLDAVDKLDLIHMLLWIEAELNRIEVSASETTL